MTGVQKCALPICTHRGNGHCIAKGADINRMMAELYGRETGYCKGKGGSMHIADFDIGMLGANGIVAGGIPIITGAAFAAQLRGAGSVAVCFFGDGASNAGSFHESINIAVGNMAAEISCNGGRFDVKAPSSEQPSFLQLTERDFFHLLFEGIVPAAGSVSNSDWIRAIFAKRGFAFWGGDEV